MIDYDTYAEFLPGLSKEDPEAFVYLARIVENHTFELLMDGEDARIVYLMNDGVESFVRLHRVRMIGEYQTPTEAEDGSMYNLTKVSLAHSKNDYLLTVRQENNNACSIYFDAISLEIHYFDYGEIGHFWIEKYEYLRWLEYQLGVAREKYEYLGKNSCNEKECIFAKLATFPPIKNYPAVPIQYRVYVEPKVEKEAMEYLIMLAKKVKDEEMVAALTRYLEAVGTKHESAWEKKITKLFCSKKHHALICLLMKEVREGVSEYANRSFSTEENKAYSKIYAMAQTYLEQERAKGKKGYILSEEPFQYAKDSITYKVHVMIWKNGVLKQHVEVTTFE